MNLVGKKLGSHLSKITSTIWSGHIIKVSHKQLTTLNFIIFKSKLPDIAGFYNWEKYKIYIVCYSIQIIIIVSYNTVVGMLLLLM